MSVETEPSAPVIGDVPLERVEAELCTLAGQLAAATARFLQLLADFDARRGWAEWDGVRSCAHWLSWRCGLDPRTAREQVRVARAMADLPRVRAAFGEGRLSYSKVRAIARVGTPANEADLVDAALSAPAAQVERLTRGLRRAARASDADDDMTSPPEPCRVSWRWDDDGELVIWGRLSGEDGARLLAGLTRAAAMRTGNDERTEAADEPGSGSAEPLQPAEGPASTGSAEPLRARPDLVCRPPADLGPALVTMAELTCDTVQAPRFAPAAEVLVHADAETLARAMAADQPAEQPAAEQPAAEQPAAEQPAAEQPAAESAPADPPAADSPVGRVDDGPPLTDQVLTRLACAGGIRLLVRSRVGATLDLGRRRRRPNDRQLLALWQRDRGCIVPGCGATRFLHAHHVRPWALGGPTSLDNLVLLCGEHHRAVHDGALHIVNRGGQRFEVHGAGGAARPVAPPTWGSADDLIAAHADIGPDGLTPDWDGSGLDLHHAVSCYLDNWQLAQERLRQANR